MSKERGRITPVPQEAYTLRDIMSKVTGVRYDVRESLPDFPPPAHHTSWYLLGSEFRGPKSTAHAHVCWEDSEGNVFIQSMYIGNTTEWIGPIYGEKGAIASFKIDYSDFNRARKTLTEKFPAVAKRIGRYETILSNVSRKHHVAMSLQCEGDVGTATFRIAAKISRGNQTEKEDIQRIKQSVGALREAWDEIARYDQTAEAN